MENLFSGVTMTKSTSNGSWCKGSIKGTYSVRHSSFHLFRENDSLNILLNIAVSQVTRMWCDFDSSKQRGVNRHMWTCWLACTIYGMKIYRIIYGLQWMMIVLGVEWGDSLRNMMTSSNGNIFHFTGLLWEESTDGFPSPRPVTQSFDTFFDLRLNKQLSK